MFGIDIIDASLWLAMLIALAGGIVSFLSPCVLPIVPSYLAYMAGSTLEDVTRSDRSGSRVILAAVFFVLGLSTVFFFLGLAASALGQAFLAYKREMEIAAGAVVILFGLHFLGVLRIPLLYREARIDVGSGSGGVLGAYVLGLAFAFGWTPCIGPILGTVLSLAAQEGSVERGIILLGVYALGLGLPFLLAAVFMSRAVDLMQRFRRHLGTVEKLMGAFLVFVGAMLLTGAFSSFSFWLLETFPALARIG
ncbi:MAG: cytochrome c biogenesis CcdA family protein [Paracoccaceae bacterium]